VCSLLFGKLSHPPRNSSPKSRKKICSFPRRFALPVREIPFAWPVWFFPSPWRLVDFGFCPLRSWPFGRSKMFCSYRAFPVGQNPPPLSFGKIPKFLLPFHVPEIISPPQQFPRTPCIFCPTILHGFSLKFFLRPPPFAKSPFFPPWSISQTSHFCPSSSPS